jgi:hypothetical protein
MAGRSNGVNLKVPIRIEWENNIRILKSTLFMWIQRSVMGVESVQRFAKGMSLRFHTRPIPSDLKTVSDVKPALRFARRKLSF